MIAIFTVLALLLLAVAVFVAGIDNAEALTRIADALEALDPESEEDK